MQLGWDYRNSQLKQLLMRARTDSNRQPSDPKMSMRGVHGVLMKPKGLDPLRLKSRETAKGLLSFSRTADHLTDLIFLWPPKVGSNDYVLVIVRPKGGTPLLV